MTAITTDGLPHDYEIVWHREVPKYATYGRIYDKNGIELCVAIGRPWVDDDGNGKRDPNVSRFVTGLFKVVVRKSHKHEGGTGKRDYDVLEFVDVPDIQNGQIHIANWPWQLEGCVGAGSAFGNVLYKGETVMGGTHPRIRGRSYPGVTGSQTAFDKLMKDVLATMDREKRDHVWIRVTERFPIAK